MAGQWIKFEVATSDKPEVWAIATKLDIDPDAVVGKLLRVWSWFDEQTEDGNAPIVTKALLDRRVGVTGFCDAMVEVGWMLIDGNCISLPKFSRHNGQTAKNRALTARRVAEHKAKGNAEANGEVTQAPLPREEKRREESKNPPNPPSGGGVASDRFDEFWAKYPRRVGKEAARKAWRKLDEGERSAVIEHLPARIRGDPQWQREGGKFIPHPQTFLNQKRWLDEYGETLANGTTGEIRHWT